MTQQTDKPQDPMVDTSKDERTWAALAHFSALLIAALPYSLAILFPDNQKASFLGLWGGPLALLISAVIYFTRGNRSEFVAQHAIKALKLNGVCTAAIALIILPFAGQDLGPSVLLPTLCVLPFLAGGPIIGFLQGANAYSPGPKK